jgi:hypothetical protein
MIHPFPYNTLISLTISNLDLPLLALSPTPKKIPKNTVIPHHRSSPIRSSTTPTQPAKASRSTSSSRQIQLKRCWWIPHRTEGS